jgi:hypothetical protein
MRARPRLPRSPRRSSSRRLRRGPGRRRAPETAGPRHASIRRARNCRGRQEKSSAASPDGVRRQRVDRGPCGAASSTVAVAPVRSDDADRGGGCPMTAARACQTPNVAKMAEPVPVAGLADATASSSAVARRPRMQAPARLTRSRRPWPVQPRSLTSTAGNARSLGSAVSGATSSHLPRPRRTARS